MGVQSIHNECLQKCISSLDGNCYPRIQKMVILNVVCFPFLTGKHKCESNIDSIDKLKRVQNLIENLCFLFLLNGICSQLFMFFVMCFTIRELRP